MMEPWLAGWERNQGDPKEREKDEKKGERERKERRIDMKERAGREGKLWTTELGFNVQHAGTIRINQ